jgi:hypothetical protein
LTYYHFCGNIFIRKYQKQKPINMTEIPSQERELTPDALRTRLDQIGLDYLAYAAPTVSTPHTTSLALTAASGERIIISKAQKDTQPEGHFFQDLIMTIHPGQNDSFPYEQLDFNFNQKGDGQLRRRAITREPQELQRPMSSAFDPDPKEILRIAQEMVFEAKQMEQNMELEEQMQTNNQPATKDDIKEALGYLKGAIILDANNHYAPVEEIKD